jgi:hypothetical protein
MLIVVLKKTTHNFLTFKLLIMRKKVVLQLALWLNFWVAPDTCNSLYLYIMNVIGQITWIAKLQRTVYMVKLIAIQLQINQNNLFSTVMQLHYNYTHDVMFTSLIVIHPLKFNMWHYEDFWTYKLFYFWNIDLHHPLWLLMIVWDCNIWHNKKFT